MRFFPREKGKTAFSEKNPRKRPFSLPRVGKNRISQGVENRGSLISVPLALRERTHEHLAPGHPAGRPNLFPPLPSPLPFESLSQSLLLLQFLMLPCLLTSSFSGGLIFTTIGADVPGRNTGKNSTGNNFLENIREFPEIITSTGAKM